MKRTIVLLFLVVSCVACLSGENRHAFYLEPDGSATWAVLREDVRSNEKERAARQREESEYLRSVRRGDDDVTVALYRLGATRVESTIVRDVAPYTVLTEGRFDSSATMLENFLREIGFEARASLSFEGERTTLTIVLRESAAAETGTGGEESPVESLAEPAERYRFVLTEGKFVESTGFRIFAGDSAAVLLEEDERGEESARVSEILSLTWVTGS